MENQSWSDYFLGLLVKSYRRSGLWLGMLAFAILGDVVFFIMYALGYGDWVPEKYLWLKQLIFWK